MQRLVFISLLALMASFAKAQELRYGIIAGYDTNSETKSSISNVSGFHAGLRGEIALKNNLYASASLMLSYKGKKHSGYGDLEGNLYSWSWKPYFLDIPIHVGYKLPVGKNVALFGEVGPYFGIGLSCKGTYTEKHYKNNFSELISSKEEKISNYFKGNLKRFDWGVGGNVGIELFRHYQISLGYDFGLKDLYVSNSKIKYRTFKLSAAYMF